ncbi:MAG: phosphate ABC transporter substrate-binding protein [bacterium]
MQSRTTIHATLAALSLACATTALAGPVTVDPAIKPYTKIGGVSGSVNSIGSDTLNNVMTLWAEGFKQAYPNVKIQIEGKGSSTAPPALISGSAQLGPMSREMKPSELDEFEKKFGYPPTKIRVAIDALAVFVNKDNPLDNITLTQVDAVFSKGRTCGGTADITTWGQLGLSGSWAQKPMSLYGRNSASGTYGFFKEHALCNGDYKDTVKEQPGSASVVQGIAEDGAGIGYSGIGYKTSGVKTLGLAKKDGEPFISTDAENVYAGKYPLARFLYVYVNQPPNKPLDPLIKQFMLYVLGQQGQIVVVKDGYLPLLPKMVEQQLGVLH